MKRFAMALILPLLMCGTPMYAQSLPLGPGHRKIAIQPTTLQSVGTNILVPTVLSDLDLIRSTGRTAGFAAAMPLMRNKGVTFLDPLPTTRPLPSFFSAISVNNSINLPITEVRNYPLLKYNIKVIRLTKVDEDAMDAMITYVTNATDTKFVFIVAEDVFNPKVAKLISQSKPIAIILGHYIAADNKPETFQQFAFEVIQYRETIRRLCDAPILLSCSYVPFLQYGTPNIDWTSAFGQDELAKFDGFAIYNVHNFALLEMTDRQHISIAIGVPPDKPTIALDFLGTRGVDSDNQLAWDNKKGRFYDRLKAQGWRGIMYISMDGIDDANLKAGMVTSMPPDDQFKQ